MKKILATILALVLALGLTATVWAEGDGTASGSMTGADFLAKAKDGVITLTDDVTLSTSCSISDGQTYTINLNGHTLSANQQVIRLTHGKVVVNGKGTIKESAPYLGAILIKGSEDSTAENYSVVEINEGVTLEGWSAIFVDQLSGAEKKPYAYGVSITVNGAVLNGAKDTDGSVGNGLYVNGSITHTKNAPEISLKNTTITATGEGMYLAGYATTTLTNCDITGVTGVEIRAGKLTVNGGSFTATAPYSVSPNGNGSTTVGAAIAVAQHTTKKNIEVTLNGGTYTGEKAISESNPQANTPAPQVAMSVTAGTFAGDVVTEDVTNFISGGTFSSDVSTYAADNTAVAEVKSNGQTTYAVGSAAIAAAANSGADVTVTKAGPVSGVNSGVSIKVKDDVKGVTINDTPAAAGTTYTVPAKYYYTNPTTTTTPDTTTKGSPKTFDAGVGIYAVTAVLSVTGMAWTAKKRH